MRRWLVASAVLVQGCAYGGSVVSWSSSGGSSSREGAAAGSAAGGGGAGPACGDGFVDPGEEWDDGDVQADDGCSSCVIECDPAAAKNPTNGHCYRVFATAKTWAAAEASCQAWGGAAGLGHLVSIENASEQAFVAGLVTQAAWIGGGDAAAEGLYTWTDGAPWTYQIFAPNEPNDTTVEDCIFMRADGDWDDHDCAYTWPSYVCERRGAGTF